MALQIVELVVVFGSNSCNAINQYFCLAMEASIRWPTLLLITNIFTKMASKIIIDYYNLPIKYHFCLSTKHLIKECKDIKTQKDNAKNKVIPSFKE